MPSPSVIIPSVSTALYRLRVGVCNRSALVFERGANVGDA